MNWRIAVVFPLLLLLTSCAKTLPRADLGVDVYLHPEAASVDDILLQAAIQKKIGDSLPGRAGLVHVRSTDRIVFLSGSVASADDHKKAIEAARNVDLRVDGKPIQPAGEIHSERLLVTR
jgi:osmotically-inducible protein OsmY